MHNILRIILSIRGGCDRAIGLGIRRGVDGRVAGCGFPVSRRWCHIRRALCLIAMWTLSGCGGYGPPSDTEGLQNLQPVTGSVSFKGEPTPGAVVLFVPRTIPNRRIAEFPAPSTTKGPS